jgi:hypothetical protein
MKAMSTENMDKKKRLGRVALQQVVRRLRRTTILLGKLTAVAAVGCGIFWIMMHISLAQYYAVLGVLTVAWGWWISGDESA